MQAETRAQSSVQDTPDDVSMSTPDPPSTHSSLAAVAATPLRSNLQHQQQHSVLRVHSASTEKETDAVRSPAGGPEQHALQQRPSIRSLLVDYIWPGLGLFGESYLLFSVGLLRPFWNVLFAECFQQQTGGGEDDEDCPSEALLLESLTYSVLLGIILGMVGLGYAASHVGRRKGSLLTASLMASGSCGMVLSTVCPTTTSIFGVLTVSLFVLGVGIGGEYPLAASSACEQAMVRLDGTSLSRRGRRIQLVFSMQGLGILCNALFMTLLLAAFNQRSDNYSLGALWTIWRLTYLLGALVLFCVLVTRYLFLQESFVWSQDQSQQQLLQKRRYHTMATPTISNIHHQDIPSDTPPCPVHPDQAVPFCKSGLSLVSTVSSLSAPSIALQHYPSLDSFAEDGNYYVLKDSSRQLSQSEQPSEPPIGETNPAAQSTIRDSQLLLLLKHYGVRLLGVSVCWMVWDVAFYGNKLFQSRFLLALTDAQGETTLYEFCWAATLNAFVAWLGYLGAAALGDFVGRCKLQQYGFLVTGVFFVACGFLLSSQDISAAILIALYLGTSFFGQLGPNATTFAIPAEIFPTSTRTICHGIAAASGKVGAFLAAVSFHHVQSELDLFLLSGYACFAACAVTFWAIPETQGLNLHELDTKWRLIVEGRKSEYEGPANNPEYLSYYERGRRASFLSMHGAGYNVGYTGRTSSQFSPPLHGFD